MLRALPNLDVLRHEIRRRVCAHCRERTPHTESLGPEVARPCEVGCPVFTHLPRLCGRAVLTDPMLRPRGAVLDHLISEICARRAGGAPSRGPAPAPHSATGHCPLASHRQAVVSAILDVIGRA